MLCKTVLPWQKLRLEKSVSTKLKKHTPFENDCKHNAHHPELGMKCECQLHCCTHQTSEISCCRHTTSRARQELVQTNCQTVLQRTQCFKKTQNVIQKIDAAKSVLLQTKLQTSRTNADKMQTEISIVHCNNVKLPCTMVQIANNE